MQNFNKKEIIIVVAVILIIFGVIGYYFFTVLNENKYEEVEILSENKNENDNKIKEKNIVVHIAGEVNSPGIIKINEESRIADVIEAAGGLTMNANIKNINLAYIVEDGQKIIIPSNVVEVEEYIQDGPGENIIDGISKGNSKININKATAEELTQIPGVGESTAVKIITYRNENGKFNVVEDIKNISGIGDSKFEAIKDYISVK